MQRGQAVSPKPCWQWAAWWHAWAEVVLQWWRGVAALSCCRDPESVASLGLMTPRSDCKSDENWTCITFYPDLERFGMEGERQRASLHSWAAGGG